MTAMTALLGFALWTALLVGAVFLYRGVRVLGGTAINAWPRGSKPTTDAPFVKRLEDAHANSLENLPLFAVIVLAAAALNKTALIEPFCAWVLYARVAQSSMHLIATTVPLVLLRATFWGIQIGLFFFMFYKLLALKWKNGSVLQGWLLHKMISSSKMMRRQSLNEKSCLSN